MMFVMLHPGFVRYYEDAVRAMADAGHEVILAFEVDRTKLGEDATVRRLAQTPRITCGAAPERSESVRDFLMRQDRTATRSGGHSAAWWSRQGRDQAWESLATTVRLLGDYLRFFDPAFADADALRARAEKRVPRVYRGLMRLAARGGGAARAALADILTAIEHTIPPNRDVEAFLRAGRPDLLLVTPLVELGSQQVDYIKCARRLGVRSALCVASWDNLTSKGLVRVLPDHVVVWNEAQKREAVALHGVPDDRVLVTGAQPFDRWFSGHPARSREAFCLRVGLDPARPFVLYVGSSVFIAPDEVPFVERWRCALARAADPAVRNAGVLLRPHPANARQWRALDPDLPDTALWPPIGSDPSAPEFRDDYFDSIYHSAAVVGINTSAQIEAAILRRPVLTVRAREFAHAQAGTLHFQHLVDPGSGFVQVASTLQEHVEQLGDILSGRRDVSDANDRFVRSFIRPYGAEVPAVPAFVSAIDALAHLPRARPASAPVWAVVSRPAAAVLAQAARLLADGRPLWVYGLRPLITAAVWGAAIVVRIRLAWGRAGVPALRRAMRAVRGRWHEWSRTAGRRTRRANKRVAGIYRRWRAALSAQRTG
jgi:hypothetical protein